MPPSREQPKLKRIAPRIVSFQSSQVRLHRADCGLLARPLSADADHPVYFPVPGPHLCHQHLWHPLPLRDGAPVVWAAPTRTSRGVSQSSTCRQQERGIPYQPCPTYLHKTGQSSCSALSSRAKDFDTGVVLSEIHACAVGRPVTGSLHRSVGCTGTKKSSGRAAATDKGRDMEQHHTSAFL